MPLSREHKNVYVLATAQALFVTVLTITSIVGGLIGSSLAAHKALATLPFTAIVIA